MKLSKEYFRLQIKFCRKFAEITGKNFIDILYLYSDFFNRLWIGRVEGDVSEDYQSYIKNPEWEDFIKNYYNSKKPVGSCYRYYLKGLKDNVKKLDSAFRYEIKENGKVMRIHINTYYRENKYSPLSHKNIKFRKDEMRKMLYEVKKKYPRVKLVRGHSWLYQIGSYRRLFPKNYLDSAKEVKWSMQGFSLWGQFINSKWKVKKELSKSFLEKVRKAKTIDDLWDAFPFMPLDLKGDIKDFYKMYSIN